VVTVGDVPPLFFAAIRVTLLAAVLSPFLFPAPRQIGMMILIAMGMAGFQFGLLFLGLSTSTAGVASVMGQLGVPFHDHPVDHLPGRKDRRLLARSASCSRLQAS